MATMKVHNVRSGILDVEEGRGNQYTAVDLSAVLNGIPVSRAVDCITCSRSSEVRALRKEQPRVSVLATAGRRAGTGVIGLDISSRGDKGEICGLGLGLVLGRTDAVSQVMAIDTLRIRVIDCADIDHHECEFV